MSHVDEKEQIDKAIVTYGTVANKNAALLY